MLDHARNSLSLSAPRRDAIPGRPAACGREPRGRTKSLRRARCSRFRACSRHLLRLTRPDIGLRTERITALVSFVVRGLDIERRWEFEVAARLSQLGCLGIAPEVLQAATRGELLSDDDLRAVASHPLAARDLLGDVSRLEAVAEMIARQHEPVGFAGEWIEPVTRRRSPGVWRPVAARVRRVRPARRSAACRARTRFARMSGAARRVRPGHRRAAHAWTAEVASDSSAALQLSPEIFDRRREAFFHGHSRLPSRAACAPS